MFYCLPYIKSPCNHHSGTYFFLSILSTMWYFFHFLPWQWRFIIAMSKISCVWVLMKCLRKGHPGRWCWFLTLGSRPMVLDGGLKDFCYPRIGERIKRTRLVGRNVQGICIWSRSNMFASSSETYCSVSCFPLRSTYISSFTLNNQLNSIISKLFNIPEGKYTSLWIHIRVR